MSLIKSYLEVLNEDKAKTFTSSGVADETKKLVGKAFGNDESEKHKAPEKGYGADENADVEEPVKGPHSENDSESLPHELHVSSVQNPFDALLNKILSEEDITDGDFEDDFEGSEDGESFDFNTAVDDQDSTEGELDDEAHEEEGEELSLHTVIDHLKSAVEALEKLAEHEGAEAETHEDEADEDFSDGTFGKNHDEDEEEEEVSEEATEIEELHPSEDLTDHKNQAVKGTTVTKKPGSKKAEVTKGVKPTGKYVPNNNKGEHLQKKSSQDAKGVKANNTPLFDQ